MILRTLTAAFAAAGALSLALPASAAEPVSAKLASPIATEARIIAGGAMFVCRDALCVATAPGSRTLAVSACRDLAKVVGPVESFGAARRALDEQKLGQCNAAAPAPAAAALVAHR
jgi:hypothetical protein